MTQKLAFALHSVHFDKHEKSHLTQLIVYTNEAISLVAMLSKIILIGPRNHATVKLDSSVASRGVKTYSESRIELQNLQILKKMLEKYSFCHQSSPVS